MRRGASGLCGLLAVDKPSGMTSHDVVDCVRRATGERRVGHAGTLDPMATGLMFVGVGAATRLSSYLMGHDKSYVARIVFGVATDTDDADGRIVSLFAESAPGEGLATLDDVDPQAVLDGIVGEAEQLPPAYSAIKKNGVVAYKAAREGKELKLERRHVRVYAATCTGTGTMCVDLDDGQRGRFVAELPYWDVELSVSKGTYIRSIARDLGQQLGCGAHLGALRRTAIAGFGVDAACTLRELGSAVEEGRGLPWCDPAQLLGFPILDLDADQLAAVSNGRDLQRVEPQSMRLRALAGHAEDAAQVCCVAGDRLVAVYAHRDGRLRPATVIPGGVVGVA